MTENFRQLPKWHFVIAVKTGSKRLLLARLHDLGAVASIVDDGPYPDDAAVSRIHVVSRMDEAGLKAWLFEHCLDYMRLSVEPVASPHRPGAPTQA